ncbi:MAG: phosphate transport system substrate-binding protein [Desulfovibrionales bacterium]|nr:phosphate transport system substrate-binding protein [Desulfovibrionales bacterium]
MKLRILALLCALTLMATPAFAGTVTVKGSTTVLPYMQKAAEVFMAQHPGVKIEISGGGSSNGAKALIDGTTDIAMMSRDMKDKEKDAATSNGRAPVQFVVAYDCITPVVNHWNSVSDLSAEQLAEIYSGKATNWKDVGGKSGQVVVISRDTSSGTYDCWKDKVMEGARVFPGALLQASNGAVVQAVAKNKFAIGYVGLAYVDANLLKPLKVDGVMASVETALNHSYPISRGLNLYTPGEPKGDAKDLIDFMMSPAGQKLAADVGFIPVKQ